MYVNSAVKVSNLETHSHLIFTDASNTMGGVVVYGRGQLLYYSVPWSPAILQLSINSNEVIAANYG